MPVGLGGGVEVEAGDEGAESAAVVANELVVPFHEASRALEDAIALILMELADLEPGLLANHAIAADFVVFAQADGVMNPPEPGQQLGRLLSDVLDSDRVAKDEVA